MLRITLSQRENKEQAESKPGARPHNAPDDATAGMPPISTALLTSPVRFGSAPVQLAHLGLNPHPRSFRDGKAQSPTLTHAAKYMPSPHYEYIQISPTPQLPNHSNLFTPYSIFAYTLVIRCASVKLRAMPHPRQHWLQCPCLRQIALTLPHLTP